MQDFPTEINVLMVTRWQRFLNERCTSFNFQIIFKWVSMAKCLSEKK